MRKPHGRKLKQTVGKILLGPDRKTALERLSQIPDAQLAGPLFAHFYHADERVKFRSIAAMGVLGSHLALKNMEKARILLRRIMWNLNDESGGMGWGSPEAMGEILFQSPELAPEFKSILFSYLDPGGNYIEHEMLQRGVLWGIGTYLGSVAAHLEEKTEKLLFDHLQSQDPVKRGYAVRALNHADRFDCSRVPEKILTDPYQVDLFDSWHFRSTRISDMAVSCDTHKILA